MAAEHRLVSTLNRKHHYGRGGAKRVEDYMYGISILVRVSVWCDSRRGTENTM